MGVWSSGMILALGDFLPKQEDKACERPWVQFPARPFIFFHHQRGVSLIPFLVFFFHLIEACTFNAGDKKKKCINTLYSRNIVVITLYQQKKPYEDKL